MTQRIAATAFLLLVCFGVAVTQNYKPAIEYQSLMNLRYYEGQGGFLVEDLQVVFPPANIGNARFVIAEQGGAVVDTLPLRFERMEFPAFGRFRPESGNPGLVRVGRSGSFVMSVVVDGQTITSMPFTLSEDTNSDPFNPGKKFVRGGPFADFAYFSVVPDDPNGEVTFNWWMSLREMPAKGARVTLHLMASGKEIASRTDPVIPSLTDWEFTRHRQISVPTGFRVVRVLPPASRMTARSSAISQLTSAQR